MEQVPKLTTKPKTPENPTGKIKYNAKNFTQKKRGGNEITGMKNRRDKWMININLAYEYLMSVSNGLSIPIKGQR